MEEQECPDTRDQSGLWANQEEMGQKERGELTEIQEKWDYQVSKMLEIYSL